MNTGERTQSYASAFLEAAAEHWRSTLGDVAATLGRDPELLDRLQAGDTEFGERQKLLDGLLPAEADSPVRNLLYTLMQRGDLGALSDVAAAIGQRVQLAEKGPTPVEVISAVELTAEQRSALAAKLEPQYGTALAFTYRVDPAILGGLIVRVSDKLIDGSVASRLADMKQALGVSGR